MRFHLAVQPTNRPTDRETRQQTESYYFLGFWGQFHDNLTRFNAPRQEIKLRKKNYFLQSFMTLLKFQRSSPSLWQLHACISQYSPHKSHHLLMMRQFIKTAAANLEARVFVFGCFFMQMFILMSFDTLKRERPKDSLAFVAEALHWI